MNIEYQFLDFFIIHLLMKTFKYCHVDFLSIIPFSNKYHSSTWLTTSQFPKPPRSTYTHRPPHPQGRGTQNPITGPPRDHSSSQGTSLGGAYVYIDSGFPRRPSDIARLESIEFQETGIYWALQPVRLSLIAGAKKCLEQGCSLGIDLRIVVNLLLFYMYIFVYVYPST